ncbi:MAG: hypothetical protein AEth_01643 [Candidatus Argoarchaeum ethanivorans]|uniref:tRNA(His) guanylyltransferase n=1 Tax=Candidatus Argoarchaeum ethanivorans TaxID=2608793 RepID=A0A8B3S217_9EURY|nr:MAG: hypothetical protein AEth_01643 [Candidatus Argoarchaeum ethanivorans]
MKEREIFSGLRAPPPIFVRVDGRGFKKAIHGLGFKKPYDRAFASAMADCTSMFFEKSGFNTVLAYLFSDEINLFFTDIPFKARVEKIDSVIASFFASALTIQLELITPISFDTRIVPIAANDVTKYLSWRQNEAWNNCVASYGYYILLKQGLKPHDAAARLKNMKQGEIHELTFQNGVNLGKTPCWQRRGIMVYGKASNNHAANKKIIQNWNIPLFKTTEGRMLIEMLIGTI